MGLGRALVRRIQWHRRTAAFRPAARHPPSAVTRLCRSTMAAPYLPAHQLWTPRNCVVDNLALDAGPQARSDSFFSVHRSLHASSRVLCVLAVSPTCHREPSTGSAVNPDWATATRGDSCRILCPRSIGVCVLSRRSVRHRRFRSFGRFSGGSCAAKAPRGYHNRGSDIFLVGHWPRDSPAVSGLRSATPPRL